MQEETGQNLIMGNMTDAQLAQIAKMNAPRKLGAVITTGAKKPPSALRLKPIAQKGEPDHAESAATMMGMQSLRTNDHTADPNPSMAQLGRELDEDSILRDVMGNQNKQSSTILTSNKKSLINEQDQRSPQAHPHDLADALLNSGDFDVSNSQSPGKLDRQLENIMDELGRINQQDDFEDLMSNIEKESEALVPPSASPSIVGKSTKTKSSRNYELQTLDLDGKANVFGAKSKDNGTSVDQTIVNNSVRQTTELGIDDLM